VWPLLWEEATEKYRQQRSVDLIQDGAADEVNPWLRRTGWIPYLRGCSTADLQQSIGKPGDDEGIASILWEAMGELAAASQETVSQSGVMLRFEAIRTERDQVRYQPLQPYRDRASVYEHCRPWQQMLMFFVRTQQAHEWASPAYRFNRRQARAYADMVAAARFVSDNDEAHSDADSLASVDRTADPDPRRSETAAAGRLEPVPGAVLRFCIELLNQTLHSCETDMALVGALAVLGLQPHGVGFRPPESFTSTLSAIIKVAHFMVVQFAATRTSSSSREYSPCSSACSLDDSGYESEGGPAVKSSFQWVRQMMDQFMVRGTGSPMQWILDLRAYGMKIAINTTSDGHVQWRDGDVLAYKNLRFSMVDFRGMVHQLVHATQRALFEDVLFAAGAAELPVIPWDQLFDNPSDSSNGWSFVDDVRTPWPVDGSQWLYRRVQGSEKLRQRFVQANGDGSLHHGRVHDWFRQLDVFRGKLLALLHLTGGQPARGTELLSVRHSNTVQGGHRNLFIENGMVVFVCRYHKGYEFKGDVKIIHRYLPREVGQLVVWYRWLALPFAQRLEALLEPDRTPSSHLWPADFAGRIYTTDRLKQELQKASLAGLGQAITVADYRHIAIAISRRFVRAKNAFHEDDAEYAGGDDDNVADEQATHSAFTAGTVYARELDELPGSSASRRQQFRSASIDWHRFLLFHRSGGGGVKHGMKRPAEPWEVQAHEAKRARQQQLQKMDAEAELSAMMQRPTHFRSVQREALTAIQQKRSRIVVVMATGAGKSLLFMLPAWVQQSSVRIVVVPLKALRQDMMHRAAALGISCAVWEPGQSVGSASIVLVTPERTKHPAFGTQLTQLQADGRLEGIYIDEAHTILHKDWGFRRQLREIGELAAAETQMVLMTATLPPTEEDQLCERMYWRREEVHFVRSSTVRDNIAYRVLSVASGAERLARLNALVAPVMQQTTRKVVIMCRTKQQISEVTEAGLFPCEPYHAGLLERQKNELLDQLRSGQLRVLVATSAFGMGVDIPDIGLVVHLDAPDNLLEYSQASGRAGRDGIASEAVLLHRDALVKDSWMGQYMVLQQCRRLVLQQYLDGAPAPVSCTDGQAACDWCTTQAALAASTEAVRVAEAAAAALVVADERHLQQQRRLPNTRRKEAARNQAQRREWTERLLERWKGRCLVCAASGHDDHHTVLRCPQHHSAQAHAMVNQLLRRVHYDKHIVCFRCGISREICYRWSADGRQRAEPERACQFYGVLAGIVGSVPLAYPSLWQQWQRMAVSQGWIARSSDDLVPFWGQKHDMDGQQGSQLQATFIWLTERFEEQQL
jgi:superfamily II DNA helicase RecQ